jgi:hypothetical protein
MEMLKRYILSICICLFFTAAIVVAFKGFDYFNNIQGYNYDSFIGKEYDWTGPKTGDVINLEYLTDENNKPLSEVSNQRLILLSVLDPECGACGMARDQMKFLQENLANKDVDYFIISFSQKLSPIELSRYTKSMNLAVSTYSWAGNYKDIIPSINKMVLPSHILVDAKGNVIKTFPGTDNQKSVRDKMVYQIIKEIIEEKSKLKT